MSVFPARILQDHDKPPYKAPCNHCGLCCRVEACQISVQMLHSRQAPCIALEVHDGKMLCGMMIRPAHYLGRPPEDNAPLIAFCKYVQGAGDGCDMPDAVVAVEVDK